MFNSGEWKQHLHWQGEPEDIYKLCQPGIVGDYTSLMNSSGFLKWVSVSGLWVTGTYFGNAKHHRGISRLYWSSTELLAFIDFCHVLSYTDNSILVHKRKKFLNLKSFQMRPIQFVYRLAVYSMSNSQGGSYSLITYTNIILNSADGITYWKLLDRALFFLTYWPYFHRIDLMLLACMLL